MESPNSRHQHDPSDWEEAAEVLMAVGVSPAAPLVRSLATHLEGSLETGAGAGHSD